MIPTAHNNSLNMRQWLAYLLVWQITSTLLVSGITLFTAISKDSFAGGMLGALLGAYVAVLIWAYVQARRGGLGWASAAASVGLLGMAVVSVTLNPEALPLALFLPLVSVVLAMSFVCTRALTAIMILAELAILSVLGLAGFPHGSLFGTSFTGLIAISASAVLLVGVFGLLARHRQYLINERRRAEDALRASEANTHALLASIPDAIFRMKQDGTVLDIKPASEPNGLLLTGAGVGRNLSDVVPLSLARQIMDTTRIALKAGEPQIFEYELPQRLGEYLIAESVISAADLAATLAEQACRRQEGEVLLLGEMLLHDGRIDVATLAAVLERQRLQGLLRTFEVRIIVGTDAGILVMVRDITERKRAEERTRRQTARTAVLAELSRALDQANLNYQMVCSVVARRIAEVTGDICVIRIISDDQQQLEVKAFYHHNPHLLARIRTMLEPVSTDCDEWPFGPVICKGQALRATLNDTADTSSSRYGAAMARLQISSLLVVPLRVQGRLFGTLKLARQHPGHAYSSDDEAFLQDLADRAGLAISNARLFQTVQQELAERKRAELALADANAQLEGLNNNLQRSRDLMQTIFDGLDDGLLLLDRAGAVLALNRALAELIGEPCAALVGQPWTMVCRRCDPVFPGDWVLEHLGKESIHYRRERSIDPKKVNRVLDFQILPLQHEDEFDAQMVIHIVDVTDRLQLEAQLLEQERFAANGRLAATVAHEVNTPLQAVESCLHLAAHSPAEQRQEYLNLARDEILRVGRILRQLLNLYRPGAGVPSAINVTELLERVILLTSSTLARQGITLEHRLTPDLPVIWGRADEITQVLLNLIFNAADAMSKGGKLSINSMLRDLPIEHASAPPAAAIGVTALVFHAPFVVIDIQDSGVGITSDMQARIFDPFFTTKAHGSGLGLAISQQIMARHGGQISVQSEYGAGSTFTVAFPLHHLTQEGGSPDHEIPYSSGRG